MKPDTTIIDLPYEILDNILSYVLPDFASTWNWSHNFTAEVLTSPILQTNRVLRQACFHKIHSRTIWIYFESRPHEAFLTRQLLDDQRLSRVPPRLRQLIMEGAAKAYLSFGDSTVPPRRRPWSSSQTGGEIGPIILPFNFERLLYLIDYLSGVAKMKGSWCLYVRFSNITGLFERQMKDLFVPAVSMVRNLKELTFELDGDAWHPEQTINPVVAMRDCLAKEYMTNLVVKTAEILETSQVLRKAGYSEEASLITLSQFWVQEDARVLLPKPGEWYLGEYDPEEEVTDSDLEDELEYLDKPSVVRGPLGNQFRSLVHKLECHARLGFAELIHKYGQTWFGRHAWMFQDIGPRFIHGPNYSLLGLSVSEFKELYSSSIVFHDTFVHVVNDPYFMSAYVDWPTVQSRSIIDSYEVNNDADTTKSTLSIEQQTGIQTMATHAHMAYMLDPNNNWMLDLRDMYVGTLDEQHTAQLMTKLANRFVVIRDESDPAIPSSEREVIWCGDSKLLDAWQFDEEYYIVDDNDEGNNVLEYLPLAQKGLDISLTYAEWGRRFAKD